MEILIGLFILWIIWMIWNEIRKNKFVDMSLFESTKQAILSGQFDEAIYKSHVNGLTSQEIVENMMQALINALIKKAKLHRSTLNDSEFQSKYRLSLKIAKDSVDNRLAYILKNRNDKERSYHDKEPSEYTQKDVRDILDSDLEITDEELYNKIDQINELIEFSETSLIIEFSDIPVQEDIIKQLAKHSNLTKLKLSFMFSNITKIPKAIFSLNSLKVLHISNIEMTELQSEIGNLTNLETLTVIQTNITTIPESISQLTKLVTLELEINDITHLPSSIGELSNLRILCLHNNKLVSLPDSMENLLNLEELDLQSNPTLASVPNFIEDLQKDGNLRTVLFDHNDIEY